MNNAPLIFTHYGNTPYLKYTLECARRSNPSRELILLGDDANRAIAAKCGWRHMLFEDFASERRSRFGRVFRHVQGRRHKHIKGNRDWLRFVFERWFCVEAFVAAEGITNIWHFDSDTMLLHDLQEFAPMLDEFRFSTQCNGTCLNGFTESQVVSAFCEHILRLFEDVAFLAEQQREFDTLHPFWAFTEMRAFSHFMECNPELKKVRLLQLPGSVIFDECLRDPQGFETTKLRTGEVVKNVIVRRGRFFGYINGRELEFASLNLSWVQNYVFEWVLRSIEGRDSTISDALPSLRNRVASRARDLRSSIVKWMESP